MSDFNVKFSYSNNGRTNSQQDTVSDYESIFSQYERIIDDVLQQNEAQVFGFSNLWYSKTTNSFTEDGAQSLFYGYKLGNQVFKTLLARKGANFCSRAVASLASDFSGLVTGVRNSIRTNATNNNPDEAFLKLVNVLKNFARTKFVAGPVVTPLIPEQLMIVTYNHEKELNEIIPNVLKAQLLRHYGVVLLVHAHNHGLQGHRAHVRTAQQLFSVCGLYNGLQTEFSREREKLQQQINQEQIQNKQLRQERDNLHKAKINIEKDLEEERKKVRDCNNDLKQTLGYLQSLLKMYENLEQEVQRTNDFLKNSSQELQELRNLENLLNSVEERLLQIEQEGSAQ